MRRPVLGRVVKKLMNLRKETSSVDAVQVESRLDGMLDRLAGHLSLEDRKQTGKMAKE